MESETTMKRTKIITLYAGTMELAAKVQKDDYRKNGPQKRTKTL